MRFMVGLILCAILAGCSSVSTRIEKNRDAFDRLTPAERKTVAQGNITEGMSRDAVRIAWGRPDRITQASQEGRNFEIWTYFRYQQETVPDYQYVPRRVGRGYINDPLYSPRTTTNTSLDRRAVFEKDRVVTWELTAWP